LSPQLQSLPWVGLLGPASLFCLSTNQNEPFKTDLLSSNIKAYVASFDESHLLCKPMSYGSEMVHFGCLIARLLSVSVV
jgi:hypothetical protein